MLGMVDFLHSAFVAMASHSLLSGSTSRASSGSESRRAVGVADELADLIEEFQESQNVREMRAELGVQMESSGLFVIKVIYSTLTLYPYTV